MKEARESYLTLGRPSRYEPDKIKGSRFIACVSSARSEDEAKTFRDEVRAEFDDARHVCYAWRLGQNGDETRYSDDGEPSGSSGRPILLQIEGHDVTDAAICVVRYFGGTKLGVGGLMRAYGGAAGQALDRAEIVSVDIKDALRCVHAYGDSGAVQSVLSAHDLTPEDANYTDETAFTIRVGVRLVAEVTRALRDATGARIRIERIA